MTRKLRRKHVLLATVVILVVAFAANLVTYQAASVGREPSPFVELFRPDSPDCPVFCWHGIQVGETPLDEAEALARHDPAFTAVERVYDHVLVWETTGEAQFFASAYHLSDYADNRIDFLTVQPKTGTSFTVLDALLTWGKPLGLDVLLCSGADSSHGEIKIYFNDSIRISVEDLGLFDYAHATDTPEIRLEPTDPVAFIRFYSPSDRLTSTGTHKPWEGFRGWQRSEAGFTNICMM
jgi:hypothetical protein